jgi:hypothetical protein
MRELGQQVVRTLPFEPLDQPADAHLWGDRDKQVHVVLRHVPLQDLDLLLPAALADQLADPEADLAGQDRFALRGHPHEVQMDLEDAVCSMPVVHAASLPQALLKLSPEGEGFNPPNVGQ